MSSQNKNVFFIGMPSVGKSYWAEQLAAKRNCQYIDLDDIIAVRTGMTINAFFNRFGEEEFRNLEHSTLKQVIQVFPNNTIVACGGGTPCFYDNMELMKTNGKVIYLNASLSFLWARLEEEKADNPRPLLQTADPKATLEALYQSRRAIYEKADFSLAAKDLCMEDFDVVFANEQL